MQPSFLISMKGKRNGIGTPEQEHGHYSKQKWTQFHTLDLWLLILLAPTETVVGVFVCVCVCVCVCGLFLCPRCPNMALSTR